MSRRWVPSDSEGVRRIAAERTRQIAQEGWDDDHDDEHGEGELALAAVCYASPEPVYVRADEVDSVTFSDPWPWDAEWDKRKEDPTVAERIRELEKAGALIAAEIDRLLREVGVDVALIADRGRERLEAQGLKAGKRCDECAFTAGTIPNRSLDTLADAIKCAVEGVPFYCHKGPDPETTLRLCGGWLDAIAHPALRDPARVVPEVEARLEADRG